MVAVVTNSLSRMKLPKILERMGQHLSPLFLRVTKPLSLSPLARMTTGWCIFPSAMFRTMSGGRIGTLLSSLDFYLFQKVCKYLLHVVFYSPNDSTAAAKKHTDEAHFRKFKKQVFHTALAQILWSLKPHMTTPEVLHCPDRHFHRVIYGIGPYIADYPEQVLLACIVQNWCGR